MIGKDQMAKILVTYATSNGSTAEVARAIGEELQKSNQHVEVLPLESAGELDSYDAVVVGAPMIMGWHRQAVRFIRKNRKALKRLPLAAFVTCMSLTKTGETQIEGVPVYVDENLPVLPQRAEALKFKERYARISNYLRPILKACPVKPVSIGIFGGRLDYGHMQWWAMIFVILILQAKAGDRRNWPGIRAWATSLAALFNATTNER